MTPPHLAHRNIISFLYYRPRVQLFDRKNHVPVLAPDNVAVLDGEAAELAGVEVLVVLRVGMAADELADVHRLHGVVAERQADCQVARVLGLDDVKSLHALFLLL